MLKKGPHLQYFKHFLINLVMSKLFHKVLNAEHASLLKFNLKSQKIIEKIQSVDFFEGLAEIYEGKTKKD